VISPKYKTCNNCGRTLLNNFFKNKIYLKKRIEKLNKHYFNIPRVYLLCKYCRSEILNRFRNKENACINLNMAGQVYMNSNKMEFSTAKEEYGIK